MAKNGNKPTTKAQKKVIDGQVIEPKQTGIVKHEKKTEIAPQNQSAESLISQAINKGVSVDTMERLMKMRREMKEEYAKEQFDKSLADFQSECPVIKKTKNVLNKDKVSTRYKYAPLDAIVNQVRPLLQRHGFSYSINAKVENSTVMAIMKVTHRAGHSETSEFQIPIDPDAFMNQQQKFASALTFAKRYAFCNAFGILTGDDDDDGVHAGMVDEKPKAEAKKVPSVDYLGQLKAMLFKNGGKTESQALQLYNDYAGESCRSLKVSQEEAKDMLWKLTNSPLGSSLKK